MRFLFEVRTSVVRLAFCRGWGEPHPLQNESGRQQRSNLLAQNLRRCPEPEALPGRVVQPISEGRQIDLGQLADARVEREEATDTAVAVLNATLLPVC